MDYSGLKNLQELHEKALLDEGVWEVCPDCEGKPNAHDPGSGMYIDCMTCNHEGGWKYYPDRNLFKNLYLALAPTILEELKSWQPIETAPKVGDVLLTGQLVDGSWITSVGSYSLEFGEVCQRGTLVTGWKYWMPLPKSPVEV